MSGSGISWAICKSAPCSRQTTTPVPHHSVFYRPDALPAAQPTASKHWYDKWLWNDSDTKDAATTAKSWVCDLVADGTSVCVCVCVSDQRQVGLRRVRVCGVQQARQRRRPRPAQRSLIITHHYTVFQKGRHQTHGNNSVNSQPIFKLFFTVGFSCKFAAKCLWSHRTSYASLHHLVKHEYERQSQTNAVINDKLQSTVVTYLRCGKCSPILKFRSLADSAINLS